MKGGVLFLASLVVVGLIWAGGRQTGPKTQQAIGMGLSGVGGAVAPYVPPVGIPLVGGGAAITIDGAMREEQK